MLILHISSYLFFANVRFCENDFQMFVTGKRQMNPFIRPHINYPN